MFFVYQKDPVLKDIKESKWNDLYTTFVFTELFACHKNYHDFLRSRSHHSDVGRLPLALKHKLLLREMNLRKDFRKANVLKFHTTSIWAVLVTIMPNTADYYQEDLALIIEKYLNF